MKLKEICEINPKTREIDDDTEVSFVPMPSVTEDGKIDTSDIRSYQDVKKGYTVFQEGDVLFAKITPCMENGKGAIAYGLMNGIGCGSSEFHVLRPNKGVVTAEWIYYLTAWEWFRNEAEKHMTGSAGQKRVPKAYLENYVVNVPSFEEQKKQTKVLVQLQHIIDDRKKELICLDDIIKVRFVELFGNKGENPNGYSEDTLGNLYKFQYGKGNNIPEDKGEYPCYGSNGIVGHHTEFNSEDAPIIGHIGAYAGIVNWGKGKHYVTYNGVICKLKTDRINPIYGFYLLQQQDFNRVATKGGGQPFVSYGDLESPTVVVPPIEVQNDYAAFAKQVDKSKFKKKLCYNNLEKKTPLDIFCGTINYYESIQILTD